MSWSTSKVFVTFLEDALENTAAYNLGTDTINASLYGDITPDATVATAARTVGGGVWTSEIYDGTEWDQYGEPLTSKTSTTTSNVYKFDAVDTPSGGSSATLADVYGCLVHDSTLSRVGLCFNYFGGAQSV
jgi:hypothetical protein